MLNNPKDDHNDNFKRESTASRPLSSEENKSSDEDDDKRKSTSKNRSGENISKEDDSRE